MFVIIQWKDKPGQHSGEYQTYKAAAEAAKKLSRELQTSVSVRHVDTGQYWARFVNGKKVVW